MKRSFRPLILAAGSGSRMGAPKIFCRFRKTAFVELIIRALPAGLPPPLIVVGAEHLAEALHRYGFRAEWVINPEPERGMLSSVAAGFKASRSAACIVIPVDVPCFQRKSCERLLAHSSENPGAIVRPLYRGRGGHPLIVPAAIGAFLDQGGTLREALTRSGIRQVTCELDDPGLVFNINSPEDLRRAENELPGV